MKRINKAPTAAVFVCAIVGIAFIVNIPAVAQEAGTAATKPADSDAVKFSREGMVELHVRGLDLRQVLQMLSTQNRINIVATKEVTGTVTVDLYGVSFTEALDAVLESAGFVYVRKGNFIYVYTPKQLAKIQAAQRKVSLKVFRLNYITADDAEALIKPAISEDGTISKTPTAAVGVASSTDNAGGNALAIEDVLVVRDYPENLLKVTDILRRLDVRPQQVLIEATILRATLNENNALGLDITALCGADFRTFGYTSTDLMEVTPGAVPDVYLDRPRANMQTDFSGMVNPGGLTIGYVYNQFAFFLRALEDVTDVVVLANPKLLIMNKQRGQIMVGRKDGYLTTIVTETTATQAVEFLETGTQLFVRPYIASDGYVRLEVHPEDSTGGLTADQLPWETTTECTSNVLVKDGHTIIIGGLFRESTSNNRSQIPVLGNIPIAGALFRGRADSTIREEVVILITPHIIKHPVDEEVSEQYKDQVQRVRLGLRRQMMWFGRSRLAQAHMRWARHHITRGHNFRALWDLNITLSLEPRMEEALRLKERLTKEAVWAHEPRYSETGYVIQRMIMQNLGQPTEKVTIPLKPADGIILEKEIRRALGIGHRIELPFEETDPPLKPAKSSKEKKPPTDDTTKPVEKAAGKEE